MNYFLRKSAIKLLLLCKRSETSLSDFNDITVPNSSKMVFCYSFVYEQPCVLFRVIPVSKT